MDAVTTVTMASEVANSQVVWSILCIGLTVYVLWSARQEKKVLLENLKELSTAQTSQVETMKEISGSLKNLEGRMEKVERSTDRYGRGGD